MVCIFIDFPVSFKTCDHTFFLLFFPFKHEFWIVHHVTIPCQLNHISSTCIVLTPHPALACLFIFCLKLYPSFCLFDCSSVPFSCASFSFCLLALLRHYPGLVLDSLNSPSPHAIFPHSFSWPADDLQSYITTSIFSNKFQWHIFIFLDLSIHILLSSSVTSPFQSQLFF